MSGGNSVTPADRLPLTCYVCRREEKAGEAFAPMYPLHVGARTLVACPEHVYRTNAPPPASSRPGGLPGDVDEQLGSRPLPSTSVPSAALGDHGAPTEPRTAYAREIATGARRGELEDGTSCAAGRLACWDCGHGLSIDQWSRTVPDHNQTAKTAAPRPVGGGLRLVAVLLDIVRPITAGPDGKPRNECITLAVGRAHGPVWGATVILDSRTSRDWPGELTQAELEQAEELLYRERLRLIACEVVAERQGRSS